MRAPVLIGGVGGPVGIELLLQAPARLKQPLRPVPRDRAALALALALQRTTTLAQPCPATLRARDELLRIELDLDPILIVIIAGVGGLLAREALLGLEQRLAATLAGA